MVVKTQSEANKWLIGGFVVEFAGNVIKGLNAGNSGAVSFGLLVVLAGSVAFVYGCMLFAQAKGQNKWWGLLGLFSLLGLVVLLLIPDKKK